MTSKELMVGRRRANYNGLEMAQLLRIPPSKLAAMERGLEPVPLELVPTILRWFKHREDSVFRPSHFVQLLCSEGYSKAVIASELGVPVTLVTAWYKERGEPTSEQMEVLLNLEPEAKLSGKRKRRTRKFQ